MKKMLKNIVAIMMITVFSFFVSGCSGDKFEGKWYNKRVANQERTMDVTRPTGKDGFLVGCFDISKNGDGYIVERKYVGYDLAEDKGVTAYGKAVKVEKRTIGWNKQYVDYNPAYRFYKLEGYWGKIEPRGGKVACKVEGNALNNLAFGQIIYDEKKKVLLYGNEEYVKMTDAEVQKIAQNAIKASYKLNKKEKDDSSKNRYDFINPPNYKAVAQISFYDQNGKELDKTILPNIPDEFSYVIDYNSSRMEEKYSPDSFDYLYEIYRYFEKYEDAERFCTKYIEKYPNNISSLDRGRVYCDMKKYDKAKEDFDKSFELANKNNSNFLLCLYYTERANMHMKMQKYDEAVKDADIAIEKYNAHVAEFKAAFGATFKPNTDWLYSPMYMKAKALFELKKYKEALPVFNTVAARSTNAIYKTRANTHIRACNVAVSR